MGDESEATRTKNCPGEETALWSENHSDENNEKDMEEEEDEQEEDSCRNNEDSGSKDGDEQEDKKESTGGIFSTPILVPKTKVVVLSHASSKMNCILRSGSTMSDKIAVGSYGPSKFSMIKPLLAECFGREPLKLPLAQLKKMLGREDIDKCVDKFKFNAQ